MKMVVTGKKVRLGGKASYQVEVSIDKPAAAVRITAPTVDRALALLALLSTLTSMSGRASCIMDSLDSITGNGPEKDVESVLRPVARRSLETRQKMRAARLQYLRSKQKPAKVKTVKRGVKGSVADKKKGAASVALS